MKILTAITILAAAGLGDHVWQQHREAALSDNSGPGEFIATAMPVGAESNKVLILAPQNCPRAGAQRARALEARLDQLGIPYVQSDHASLQMDPHPTAEQRARIDRAASVLNGTLPPVFVNGMGKANPSAEEVADVFKKTGGDRVAVGLPSQ